jgi:hypothetical protein
MGTSPQAGSYAGRCHCGAIGFTYRTAITPERWSVRACQCTFCRAHDALSSSDPQGSLEFREHEPGTLRRYRFGGRTADFLICGRCGVYIGARMQVDGRTFGIINVHALAPAPSGLPAPTPMSYEGEDAGARRDRRLARWTPMEGIT